MRTAAAFWGGLLLYAASLILARQSLAGGSVQGPAAIPIALLPIPAGAVLLGVALAHFQSQDELEQRIRFMALAVSFGGTVLLSLSWGFLEGVGFERLSGFVVFLSVVAFYVAGLLWARTRYR